MLAERRGQLAGIVGCRVELARSCGYGLHPGPEPLVAKILEPFLGPKCELPQFLRPRVVIAHAAMIHDATPKALNQGEGGPWSLTGITPPFGSTTTQAADLPVTPNGPSNTNGQPAVAYGAGSLWVTYQQGTRVVRIMPPN